MFLYELLFWSCDENVVVRNTDFRTFRYETKKNLPNSIHLQGKKSYCEGRGQNWHIPTNRPLKLKDHLQEMGDHLKDNRIIFCEWHKEHLLCLIFSSGLICYISVSINTGDITRILFDRYFVGKLPASNISGVMFSDTHLLFTYPENQAILASFNQPAENRVGVEKISNRDPKYQTIELYGSSRKSERQVSFGRHNVSAKVLIWSSASTGEIYPWSPHVRGEDRANVHIYSLKRSQMTLLAFHRIENDALSVELSKIHDNVVYSVEQKAYQKGTLTLECCTYEINMDSLGACSLTRRSGEVLSAPAPPRLVSRSPAEDRLLLACIDGSLLLHTLSTTVTQIVKAAFIPSTVCWCGDMLVMGEERGRLQCFDLALQPLPPLPVNVAQEDMPYIDVGGHLKKHADLRLLKCNNEKSAGDSGNNTQRLLLLMFDGGPLAVTRIAIATTDIGLKWLRGGQTKRAINLLRALNWDTEGNTCLNLLHSIVIHLLRSPLDATSENMLQEALGCFHLPLSPLSERTLTEYGAQLHDLSRKFFHHLVRYGRLDKALSLAVDLADSDLFMDVEYAARNLGETELADEAHSHALDAIGSAAEHSTCSLSSCSQCATSDTGSDGESLSDDTTVPNHQTPSISTNNHYPLRFTDLPQTHQRSSQKILHSSQTDLESSQNSIHLSQTNHKSLQNNVHSSHTKLKSSQNYVYPSQSNLTSSRNNVISSQNNVILSENNLKSSLNNFHSSQNNLKLSQNNVQLSQTNHKLPQNNLYQSQTNLKLSQNNVQPSHTNLKSSQHTVQLSQIKHKSPQNNVHPAQTNTQLLLNNVHLSQTDLILSQNNVHMSQTNHKFSQNNVHMSQNNHKLSQNNVHPPQSNHKFLKKHHQPSQTTQNNAQTTPREPPPLPYIPHLDHTKIISSNSQSIPVIPEEITPTHSIRPNLHQYLDRDCSLWRDICQEYDPTTYQTKYNAKPTHHLIDIIPGPLQEKTSSQNYNIYQTEIPEEMHLNNNLKSRRKSHLSTIPENNMYKSVYGPKSALSNRSGQISASTLSSNWMNGSKNVHTPSTSTILVNGNPGETKTSSAKPGEKNKVKFSDTVTIAVVPEIPRKEKTMNPPVMLDGLMQPRMDPRKELADSLPLCHPNDDYLKDFAPVPSESNHQETTTPKIKVVHFGMV